MAARARLLCRPESGGRCHWGADRRSPPPNENRAILGKALESGARNARLASIWHHREPSRSKNAIARGGHVRRSPVARSRRGPLLPCILRSRGALRLRTRRRRPPRESSAVAAGVRQRASARSLIFPCRRKIHSRVG